MRAKSMIISPIFAFKELIKLNTILEIIDLSMEYCK